MGILRSFAMSLKRLYHNRWYQPDRGCGGTYGIFRVHDTTHRLSDEPEPTAQRGFCQSGNRCYRKIYREAASIRNTKAKHAHKRNAAALRLLRRVYDELQYHSRSFARPEARKIILVTDDPDRENEGDFICAAEFATTENINFMATHGKGLICMPMSEAFVQKLQFPQMVQYNTDNHETAFTVSIDHVSTSTGISAAERSITAMACVDDHAKQKISADRAICSPFWQKERCVGAQRSHGSNR